MYYPYFRGKQFELILLRDNAELLKNNNICPIIEPVRKDFSALVRSLTELNDKETNCILILNPKAGKNPVPTSSILKLYRKGLSNYRNISIGYLLDATSNIDELLDLSNEFSRVKFSILHFGYTKSRKLSDAISGLRNIETHIFFEGLAGKLYQRRFKGKDIIRILIRDGFKPQKKNADYPPSEHFYDYITYPDEGMEGFGDYLIVGGDYSEAGGPAYAVVIHLTYLDSEDNMFIYHFLSDQTDSPTDPGGKFLEALSKP